MTVENENACNAELIQAIESLMFVLTSKDGLMRKSARKSLEAIGNCAIPSLTKGTKAKNKTVRWESTKALVEMSNPQAAEAFVDALQDEEFGVRWLAAEGLIGLGRAGLKPLMQALMRDPDSNWLREGTHHVLRLLQDKYDDLHEQLVPLVFALESLTGAGDIAPEAHKVYNELDTNH
jgi:HEAT repeat protein